MKEIELGRIEEVPLREVFADEARDFTPWLAKNLDLLGEALNLDLTLTEREGSVGTLSVDIVAESELGVVVIENQLGKTDHGHLGQLLSYAAGREARFLVWVAPTFKEEHLEALVWLNRWMPEDIEVYGVEVSLIRIEDSRPAPVFRAVASPDAPSRQTESQDSRDRMSSEESTRRIAFFEQIADSAHDCGLNMFGTRRPSAKSKSFPCNAGDSDIKYWVDLSDGREDGIMVKLYVGTKDRDRNFRIISDLITQGADIEKELGFKTEYRTPQDRQRSGWVFRRWEASIWDDEDTLEEHRRKILDTVESFQKTLDHRVNEIIEVLETEEAVGVEGGLGGDDFE